MIELADKNIETIITSMSHERKIKDTHLPPIDETFIA
jgi:hypothetical protein